MAHFCCEQTGVVVEVDGDTHVGREAADAGRTAFLAGAGYRVIRVTNPEVRDNMEGVLEYILTECQKRAGQRWIREIDPSPPAPLPWERGDRDERCVV